MLSARHSISIISGLILLNGCVTQTVEPGPKTMTFFVTSVGSGKGADLGGIDGADKHCQTLAAAAGAGHRTWRAYLSTQGTVINDPKKVDARSRIGTGPWYNAKGVLVARDVDELHSAANNITHQTAVNEKGGMVNGRVDKPNMHDMLTGSQSDGTSYWPSPPFVDMTCGNWTKSGADGSAMTGHHDRAGPTTNPWSLSWNSSHPTIGCSQEALVKTGGDGRFYCFAEK